jgi:MFS family permease
MTVISGEDNVAQAENHLRTPLAEKTEDAEKSGPSSAEGYKHEYPTGFRLTLILVAVMLAYFLVCLDLAVMSTATPSITSDFDSLVDIGWYGGAYQLASAAFQPLSGKIYTFFSIKASPGLGAIRPPYVHALIFRQELQLTPSHVQWCFLIFFLVFELGSALCGAAQSSAMFIVGRAIAGLGSSGIQTGAMSAIAAALPTNRQPLFMGINVGLSQLGIATGPIIGGAFSSNVSWRWCESSPCPVQWRIYPVYWGRRRISRLTMEFVRNCLGFYINLPLAAIVGGCLLFQDVPEPKRKPPPLQVLTTAIKSLDLMGFSLICPAAIMFFLALQFGGNQHPWDSSVVIGLFVGAAVTFGLFLLWEYRQGDAAMVPFAMLKHRVIWSAAMTLFFIFSSMLLADYYLAIYFQAARNDSPLMSGVHMLPTTISLVAFTMVSGSIGKCAWNTRYNMFCR